MTAKEKAEDLVLKFAMYLRANLMYDEEANEDAKQCALIAVDELEKQEATLLNYNSESYSSEYWQEVKTEIEKL